MLLNKCVIKYIRLKSVEETIRIMLDKGVLYQWEVKIRGQQDT